MKYKEGCLARKLKECNVLAFVTWHHAVHSDVQIKLIINLNLE